MNKVKNKLCENCKKDVKMFVIITEFHQVRIIEKYVESSFTLWKRVVGFCSRECAIKYLTKEIIPELVMEMIPISKPKGHKTME